MLLKDREFKECGSCHSRQLVRGQVYGCDTCRKVLDTNKPKADYLRANTFQQGGNGSEEIICCSWRCMVKALRKVKSNYFVSLPFLHFDSVPKGMRAADFFALMRSASTDANKSRG